ncbi:MAG: M20/M25/M40 family metallo-hydrolase [Bacteroidaceae bacterium]|nr:M20/M25/M40 family metallo-hydrolase [Bacteroidaceae bacterium]
MTDIHDIQERAWQLLRRLCAIPRVSRDEAAAANLLECYMRQMGLRPQRHMHNLWAVRDDHDAARPTLLLCAHIDTVRGEVTPEVPDGDDRITARGSNDDGASLVSLLHVFAALPPQTYNLVFLATAEEEVGGRGGIEAMVPLLPPISVALVGEPTSMQPAIAEKGLVVIDAVAHGVAGHAAREEGDNAIYRAMRDIDRLQQPGTLFPKTSPLLGAVKTSVTIINAGTQHNVVPDRCSFTIDVRTNELYSNEEAVAILRSSLESELTPRSTRLGSSRIDPRHPLVRRCMEMGLTPFGSPTLSDQSLMPFPSMKMGPGESSRSHTAHEFILRSEVDDAIARYLRLLDGLRI